MSDAQAVRGARTRRWTETADAIAKRSIDLILGIITLTLTAPFLAVALVAIRVDSRGPGIFRQVRVGRGGRPFTVYKLRTMREGNDERHRRYVEHLITDTAPRTNGGLYKLTDDQRVTRVGRVLRRFSIDELPQVWNVIRGEMSLVGPRPALPWEVELYEPEHRSRLEVKPGITGLWQVSGRSELTMREALDLDVEYASRRDLFLDLRILLRTIPVVVSRRGAA